MNVLKWSLLAASLGLAACSSGGSNPPVVTDPGDGGGVIPPFLIELMGRKSKALLLFKNRWTTIY